MKRFGGFFLTFVLILSMTSTAMAEDATHTPTETLPGSGEASARDRAVTRAKGKMDDVIRQFCINTGVVFDEYDGSLMSLVRGCFLACINDAGYDSYDSFVEASVNEDGSLDFPADFSRQFYDSVTQALAEQSGYTQYYGCEFPDAYVVNKFSGCNYLNGSADMTFLYNVMSCSGFMFVEKYLYQPVVYYCDPESLPLRSNYYYIVVENDVFKLYDSDLNLVPIDAHKTRNGDYYRVDAFTWSLLGVPLPASCGAQNNNGNQAFYWFREDTRIFNSFDALNTYVNGDRTFYLLNSTNAVLSGISVSFDEMSLKWGETMEELFKKIDEGAGGLTEEELQKLIRGEISGKLEKLAESLLDSTEKNSLENARILDKLDQIYQLLRKWYDDDLNRTLNAGVSPDDSLQESGSGSFLDTALNNFWKGHIVPFVRDLVVPDQETLDYTMSNIEENLPFIGACRDFVGFMKAAFSEDLDPVIYFGSAPSMDRFVQEAENSHTTLYPLGSFGKEPPTLPDRGDGDSGHTETETLALNSSGMNSAEPAAVSYLAAGDSSSDYVPPDSSGIVADNLGTDCLAFDFSWYEPYRIPVQRIIAGFMWIYLFWYMYRKSPRIIDGSAEFISSQED